MYLHHSDRGKFTCGGRGRTGASAPRSQSAYRYAFSFITQRMQHRNTKKLEILKKLYTETCLHVQENKQKEARSRQV